MYSLRGVISVSFVLLLSFFAVKPLFNPGFFPMHDDLQPSRVFEMAHSLSSGQFPVRIVSNLGYGYGYPLFNFYAPLPFYVGALFYLIGFDVILSTKIMFAIGILMSSVTMFLLVKELAGELAGIVSSVLYLYAPYHAVDIYIRGAVGEYYAMGFLPLVLLGIIKIFKYAGKGKGQKELKKGVVTSCLGIAGTLLSHNILGMITGYFLVSGIIIYLFYCLISKNKLSVFHILVSIFILGIGLSAFFTIPALVEKKYTRVDTLTSGGSDFRQHFVYLDQLWDSPWGYAGSALGRTDGMSYKIGKLHLLLGLLSFLISLYLYKRSKIDKLSFVICHLSFVIFIVSIFFMLGMSEFIWTRLPGFPFIQYPWRFLSFVSLALSVLPFTLFLVLKGKEKMIAAALVVFSFIWINNKYFTPQGFRLDNIQDYVSQNNLRYKISKISDEYLPQNFHNPKDISEIPKQGITSTKDLLVFDNYETPVKKTYTISALRDTVVQTNIAYFPGWQGILDGKSLKIRDFQGRIELMIPQGSHELIFHFKDTVVRIIANTISILSLFLLVYLILFTGGKFLWPKNIQSR